LAQERNVVLGRLLNALAVLAGLCGVVSFLYYWDTGRTVIKRLQASSPYKYEEVDPKHLKTDPRTLIHVRNAETVERARAALNAVIWGEGGFPKNKMPMTTVGDIRKLPKESRCPNPAREDYTTRTLGCSVRLYEDVANLAAIEQLTIGISAKYHPRVSHFRPLEMNGGLILYHHGYAGTHQDQWRHIWRWVEAGYGVLAFDYIGYGNAAPGVDYDGQTYMRALFEPIAVAQNDVLARYDYKTVNMVGLSAGGWVTAVYAALDKRIKKSYPVAGVLPLYLRQEKETAEPQYFQPMIDAASYPDMFILAATGKGRRQVQIFNRFDRCCFNGPRGRLYEDAVASVAEKIGGSFRVIVDETHPRHKISRWAFETILRDMGQP